jgi:uncharacterized protein YcgL (UPF0745 family)
MQRRQTYPPEQDEQGLLSQVVSRAFPVEAQIRMLCYLAAQCFRQNQTVKEMINEIEATLQDVVDTLKPKLLVDTTIAPRRKLEKEDHEKVRKFVKKLAQAYHILPDGSTDNELDSEDDFVYISAMSTAPLTPSGNDLDQNRREIWIQSLC